MRILIINSVCGIGSTGNICVDIANSFVMQGHEVKIAYGRKKVPTEYKSISYRIGNVIDNYISCCKARIFDNDGFNNRIATKHFIKWADDFNPDMIWLHNLHGYYINVELLFDWIKSRPFMEVKWTLHDCWAFTGHCAHFTLAKCNKWKTQCCDCVQKRVYPKSIMADNSKENFLNKKRLFTGVSKMRIITPSNWLCKLVKQSFLGSYETDVLHNTINGEVFKPRNSSFRQKLGLLNKRIVLGVASNWSESKGLNDFVELSKMLNDDYAIVLVGLTKKQAKKIPNKIITVENNQTATKLSEIYSAADVFVNLTLEDNYPTVNLEAQACGTPVITYRTGGSAESVPKENVCEVGDLEQVVQMINRIVADKGRNLQSQE